MVTAYDDMGYGIKPLELYNITEDPYQTKNIADKQPGVIQELNHLLQTWITEQQMKNHPIADPLIQSLADR